MATNGSTSFLDTFHGKTDSVYTLPNAGTSAVITPEPGAYTQFLFKIDQISNVSTRADGALEMKMVNNSTLVIANFQDLVNSAESCGRDSILQFLADQPVAGGGEPLTKIVNIAPDALARALDPALANSNTVVVHEPAPGVTHEIMMVPGKIYNFDFDMQHTAKTMDGTNLLLSFKDGGLVILRDYVPVMNGELPPALTLADGTVIDASKMLATVCAPSASPFDTLKAMAAPNIEPAAGERKVAHVVHHEPAPQKLAEIEPAAGTPSNTISGGRGGGFSSGIDAANLNGLNPLGPLGPTELQYGIPGVTDVPVLVGTPPAIVSPPVIPVDGTPTIGDQTQNVDETNLVAGPLTVSGQLANNYGSDGAGTTGYIAAQGAFASGGSQLNGVLTSNGMPVAVSLSGNTYIGTAGGQTIFTVVVNANGSYTYTQYGVLDHADGNNPNDVITLNFGVVITDADGDADTGVITINVADDAPIAHNDVGPSGNVMTNDTMSVDAPTIVSSVVFGGQTYNVPNGGQAIINGANGVLVIASNGTYTYTPSNNNGDVFTYTIIDHDGDTSSAQITIAANNNGVPVIGDGLCPVDETALSAGPTGVMGTYTYNFGPDGAGTIAATGFAASGSMTNNQLTSGGVPVTVTQNGNMFTGMANGQTVFTLTMVNGSYTFMLYKPLDHADGSNPNDVIHLDFNLQITDSNGDSDTGVIRIEVSDDAVIAIDDVGAANGNVIANDWYSNDAPMSISQVTFNGNVYTIPFGGSVTIHGTSGILVMQSNGQYTYQTTGGNGDVFTYTLRDYDGDTSSAHLTFGASTGNGMPVIGDGSGTVDETDLWTPANSLTVVNGQLAHNFGTDGAGTIAPTGIAGFSATGSLMNNQLTMYGLPVIVTQTGNKYEGHVVWPSDGSSAQVFEITINADGSYHFVLNNTLDHADGNNPNDVITLNFGVTITDANGDTDSGVITINVLDDAPIANDDTAILDSNHTASGNLYANDHYSFDDMYLKTIVANGVTHNIPLDQQVTIPTTYGTLTIQNGLWSYVANPGASGMDVITYTVIDIDGDQSSAHLTIAVNNGVPMIGDATQTVDETDLGPVTVNGALAHNFGTDGPGVIAAEAGSFNATGSIKGGTLTSNGVPIAVTLSGNTYTGMAAGVLVFVLAVHTDGTYAFTLHNNIDHADATNPNDTINLNFGVQITDANGDHDTGVITVQVLDDAPIARDDSVSATFNNNGTGNVLTNDTSHEHALVTQVTYHGQTYVVSAGVQTVINADHGQLAIGQDGHYVYSPYNTASETLWLHASASDVVGANTPVVAHNGITLTAIDPHSGATLGDLSWVYGDLNVDGTWYGEQGVGVTGNGSNFVNGQNEGLRLAFDQPTNHVSITIGGFNSMGDFVDGSTDTFLLARVYLEGANTPTVVSLDHATTVSGYGFMAYDLYASQFGGSAITRIEIYAADANTDWTLCDVSYDHAQTGGTDTFGYTIQDQDGDLSSAFLTATNATSAHHLTALDHTTDTTMIKVDSPIIGHIDPVTQAINDFVISTTHADVVAPTPANDHHYIEMPILVVDPNQYHTAAA